MNSALSSALSLFGGIATRHQLVGSGVSRAELSAAVSTGQIVRVRRGHYGSPGTHPDALRAVRIGGRLSCLSAARTYGLWAGRSETLHLRVPTNAGRLRLDSPRAPVSVVHWSDGQLSPFCWRDALEDALRGSVRCADRETAIAVLDTALGSKVINLKDLHRIFETAPRRSRRIARQARLGSESGVESITRQRLERIGVQVEQQVRVSGVGRVDMRLEGRLLVEIDGYAYHSSPESFDRDRQRDVAAQRAGLRCVRFSARQVLDDWPEVQRAIEQLLTVP
jgi:very-short-patch-repair endonuclease